MMEKFEVINAKKINDSRGFFQRTYCQSLSSQLTEKHPIQTNISFNKKKYTLRGFHFETGLEKEWKLMTIVRGQIYLVVIDLRPISLEYKKIKIVNSNTITSNMFYIPPGYANGFLTLEDETIISYAMGSRYEDSTYGHINWEDEILKDVKWPNKPIVISENDRLPTSIKL
jgi:dTDP-4-dehydrorhamnose 3,5-epimerase